MMGCGESRVIREFNKGISFFLNGKEIRIERAGVITEDKIYEAEVLRLISVENPFAIEGRLEWGILGIELKLEGKKGILKFSFHPEGMEEGFISFFARFLVPGWDDSEVLISGMQSWSPAYITSLVRGTPDLKEIRGMDEWYDLIISNPGLSWWFTGLRKERDALVMGALTVDRFKTRFYLSSGEGARILFLNGNIKEPVKGKEWSSELLYIGVGNEFLTSLRDYTAEVAKYYPPLKEPFNPVGWNSWNTFFDDVRFEDVKGNIEVIKNELTSLKVNNIQIDDGWELQWGEWEKDNPAFGASYAEFARAVTEAGFLPGIWLAPFLADEKSQVFQTHPHWFLKDREGKPLPYQFPPGERRLYILDLTNPSAMEWLLGRIKSLLDAGYRYLKLDFLFAGMVEGARLFEDFTPLQAFRSAMERIRDLAGRYHAYILACGAPILPVAGLVHGTRIGGDIAFKGTPYSWSFILNELRNLFVRLPLSSLYRLDPDTLLMRDVSIDEAKTFLLSIIVSGGLFALGDDLTTLEKEKMEILKKIGEREIFPPHPDRAFQPEDSYNILQFVRVPSPVLFVSSGRDLLPSLWSLASEKGNYIAVFNWRNEGVRKKLDLSGKRMFNLLTGEPVEGNEIFLPPHGGEIFLVK